MCNTDPKLSFKTGKIHSRTVIEEGQWQVSILVRDEEQATLEIFDLVIQDIKKTLEPAQTEQAALDLLPQRLNYWINLFRQAYESRLKPQLIQGIIGELYFLLEDLEPRLGIDQAISSWMGPEKNNQDFITGQNTFEIKAVLSNSKTYKISNENQLSYGMYLVGFQLNKTTSLTESSQTLAKLHRKISSKIINQDTGHQYLQKLLNLGLDIRQLDQYDDHAYEVVDKHYYYIDERFPFIDAKSVPSAIERYQYDLTVEALSTYEIEDGEVWHDK